MYITASTAILANAYQVGFLLDKNEHQWTEVSTLKQSLRSTGIMTGLREVST